MPIFVCANEMIFILVINYHILYWNNVDLVNLNGNMFLDFEYEEMDMLLFYEHIYIFPTKIYLTVAFESTNVQLY